MGTRIDDVNGRIDDLRTDVSRQIDDLRTDVSRQIDTLRADTNSRLERIESRLDDTNERIDAVGRDVAGLRDRTGALEGALAAFAGQRHDPGPA